MPPDDPIFDAPTSQTPTPQPSVGTTPQPNNPQPGQPPGGLTAEQVAEIAREQQKPVLEQLNQLTQSIQQLGQPPPQPPQEPTPVDPNDRLNQFMSDPDKFISDVAFKVLKERAEPAVNQQLFGLFQTHKDSLRSQVDTQYGAGTWENVFEKPFMDRVTQTAKAGNPNVLADPTHLREVVNAVAGANLDDLYKRRTERDSQTEEQRKAQHNEILEALRPQITTLTGGTSLFDRDKPELTDEHRKILASIDEKTGGRTDPEQVAKQMANLPPGQPHTESEWKAFQASKANGSGN